MQEILQATGATAFERGARVQSLWSGYGELFRARLKGAAPEYVVGPPAGVGASGAERLACGRRGRWRGAA